MFKLLVYSLKKYLKTVETILSFKVTGHSKLYCNIGLYSGITRSRADLSTTHDILSRSYVVLPHPFYYFTVLKYEWWLLLELVWLTVD